MKKILFPAAMVLAPMLLVALPFILIGCDPPESPPNGSFGTASDWTLVDKTPAGLGIYKKRNEKEGVTIYATQGSTQGAWSISVVKEKP
jgi:hypothetical protein